MFLFELLGLVSINIYGLFLYIVKFFLLDILELYNLVLEVCWDKVEGCDGVCVVG